MGKFIRKIKSSYKNYFQYIGIAFDETERLANKMMNSHKISLLAKYEYTEKMAYELCKQHNLLSPMYDIALRNGCWFCPNRNIKTMANFKKLYPELWQMLLNLDNTPNKVSPCFRYNKTIKQVDKEIDFTLRQLELF